MRASDELVLNNKRGASSGADVNGVRISDASRSIPSHESSALECRTDSRDQLFAAKKLFDLIGRDGFPRAAERLQGRLEPVHENRLFFVITGHRTRMFEHVADG